MTQYEIEIPQYEISIGIYTLNESNKFGGHHAYLRDL